MEIIRENALSIIILKSLDWPDHRYVELYEIEKRFYPNPEKEMNSRLRQICEIFREFSNFANNKNLFLVRFHLIIPKAELIPDKIRIYYFDFFQSCEDLEYRYGVDLSERLEIIINRLFILINAYDYLDPKIKIQFPISETELSNFS